MSAYSTDQQADLVEQLGRGVAAPLCPACGAHCHILDAHPRRDVAYVRRRMVVRCPSCMRSLGLDTRQFEEVRREGPATPGSGESAD